MVSNVSDLGGWKLQGLLWLPPEGPNSEPRMVINYTEQARENEILKNYIKKNNGIYEVKVPGRPATFFYNEADAMKNCRYQLTNCRITPPASVVPAATNPAPTSAAPAKALNPEAQKYLDAAKRAEQGARFRGTSQEAMNRLHHIGGESDLARYYREMENRGEIGRHLETPTPKPGLTPEAQKYLDATKRAEQGARFRGTSQEAMNRLHHIGEESDLSRWYREMENQGEIGRPKTTPKPGPKKGMRLGTRLKAFARKHPKLAKGGKYGALAALALGVGALLFNKCSDDKKDEAVAPQPKPDPKPQPEPKPEPTTPQQPEQPETPPVEIENIIQNADTLEEVANRYGITVDELKELNADKIKQFRTADGRVIEGFRVGEDINLPDGAKKVDGLKSKEEAISDYEEALIRNFDTIPQSMWNQVCTPEFRRRHKLGEYKEAA